MRVGVLLSSQNLLVFVMPLLAAEAAAEVISLGSSVFVYTSEIGPGLSSSNIFLETQQLAQYMALSGHIGHTQRPNQRFI